MAIATVTATLLGSALSSSLARKLFKTIADSRIAETASLIVASPETLQPELDALAQADLISPAPSGEKYYVTAKGLKVARDLEKIAI